ncbi:MAG: UDP-N-acetylenolpyruvoylglucosamine reductase [Gammaproteobacteria bacterium SG8_15]|nr:MAG: UDP-N-acetylenolpyruvoylglucosamine reductase [Gammaproteobacteria bacterium SG8_15]
MTRHTSWRVGGTADRYYQPADIEDLALFFSQLDKDEPITWVGLGSNLLVRDGGIRGTVIATSGVLNGLSKVGELTVRAEAGVACAKVARFCARQSLQGAEFLAGIPGTMGGALAMNAGAFGGETWNIVSAVETLDHDGKLQRRLPGDYTIAYRSVKGPRQEWFVAAELTLQPGDSEASLAKIKECLNKRGNTQPIQQPNAGSVFKNPPGDYSARLIEASGLKGYCIGGASVSDKHANFIVNTGEATAADIENLIEHVAATVKQKHGVELEREVRIIGEALV